MMTSKANQLRLQSRRDLRARKKSIRGHAKGKLLKGRSIRALKIRA